MIRTDIIGEPWSQNLQIRCNSNAVRSRSSPCAPGFACDDGVQQVCGAHNMFSFAKQGVCTVVQPGYYATPEGGTSLNLVETGIPNIGSYGGSCTCPDGQVYEVGDNYDSCGSLACVGGVEGTCMRVHNTTRYGRRVTCITDPQLAKNDQEVCPRGYYCSSGRRFPCPVGTYGSTTGLASNKCSGTCGSGVICPLGSVSKTGIKCPAGYYCPSEQRCQKPIACGGIAQYCPEMSAQPNLVTPGYYTVPETGSALNRTSERACSKGHYCSGGHKRPCGGPGWYSNPGQKECIKAPPGYYTSDDEGSKSPDPTTRTRIEPCEPGYWCAGGVRTECKAGTYGSSTKQETALCSGLCDAGSYGNATRQTVSTCSGPCHAGYFCVAGALTPKGVTRVNPEEAPCGTASTYCPPGAAAAIRVDDGSYSTPVTAFATRREGARVCDHAVQLRC